MERKKLAIFLLCIVAVITPFITIFDIIYIIGCGKEPVSSDSEEDVEEFIISKTSFVSHDIGDLKAVEGRKKSLLRDYIKNGRIAVLDSGDVVYLVKEDESHNYLYIRTFDDSIWIKKQNVTKREYY